eukprot:TRINITY_DN7074_c0_g1_i6.p1 TRINITY_DN7074_c0_g1~~TRINITY_DN7074_c0_g1_i6.p1  ORF type:complete len:1517 (-),score=379.42 TRINITY_DN7074_c0_g1_i6:28-4578(-)
MDTSPDNTLLMEESSSSSANAAQDSETPTLRQTITTRLLSAESIPSELGSLVADLVLVYAVPQDELSGWLDWLSCAAYLDEPDGVDASTRVELLQESTPQAVCSYCFKDGDLVWNCKSCQADETCVMCNACFRDSDHEGHEVFFFYSNTEGCCDCGDPSAWDAAGFCSRHGRRTDHNPLDDLPPRLASCAQSVVHQVCALVNSHVRQRLGCVTAVPEEADTLLYDLQIVRGHESIGHVISALLSVDLPTDDVTRIVRDLEQAGSSIISSAIPAQRCREVLAALRGAPCGATVLCCSSQHTRVHAHALLGLVEWLLRACRAADGLAQLVIQSLLTDDPSLLTLFIVNQGVLPAGVCSVVNSLMLQLLVDTSFKVQFGMVYSRHYIELSKQNRTAVFNFSVQFLNRDCHVRLLVLEHEFLESIITALIDVLPSSIAQGTKLPKTVHKQHYLPLVKDLRYCFCHNSFSLEISQHPVLGQKLSSLLIVLLQVQHMHSQQRVEGSHVEWETTEWMPAFNLSLTLASSFEKVVGSTLQSIAQIGDQSRADSCFGHVIGVLHHPAIQLLEQWGSRLELLEDHGWECTVLAPQEGSNRASFHNALQRYVVSFLNCTHLTQMLAQHPATFLQQFEGLLQEMEYKSALCLMEAPLRTLALAAQVQVGMWVRNGTAMQDQLLNYMRWPLCVHFFDKDMAGIQFALGAGVPPVAMYRTMLDRFELLEWLQSPSQSTHETLSLAAEMLKFVVQLATEMPMDLTSMESGVKLEREVIHMLAFKDCTHSELAGLCDQDSCGSPTEATLDAVLTKVANHKTGSSGPDTFELKPEMWSRFDPLFAHLLPEAREKANARAAPKRAAAAVSPAPVVGPPPPAGSRFEAVRVSLLAHPVCVKIVWSALAEGSANAVLRDNALQLLTLTVHCCREGEELAVQQLCNQEFTGDGGVVSSVVSVLHQLLNGSGGKADAALGSSLRWLLQQLGEEVQSSNSSSSPSREKLLARKRQAQQRALLQAKKSQTAFALGSHRQMASLQENDEVVESVCIICQGGDGTGGRVLSHIGFVQPLLAYRRSALDVNSRKNATALSSCNHLVHMTCFEDWHSKTRDDAISHSVDQQHEEFLCPLCKAPANVLCPVVPGERPPEDAAARAAQLRVEGSLQDACKLEELIEDEQCWSRALEYFTSRASKVAFGSSEQPSTFKGGQTQASTILLAETLKLAAAECNNGSEWDCGLVAQLNLARLLRSLPAQLGWSCNGELPCWCLSDQAVEGCEHCRWADPQYDLFECVLGMLANGAARVDQLLSTVAAVHFLEASLQGAPAEASPAWLPEPEQETPAMAATVTERCQQSAANAEQLIGAVSESFPTTGSTSSTSEHRVFVKQLSLLSELFQHESSAAFGELSPEGAAAAVRLFKRREVQGPFLTESVLIPRALIGMPASFADLYSEKLANHTQAKSRPAVCLLCGVIVSAATKQDGVSACTRHLESCGGDIGVYFLIQECCTPVSYTHLRAHETVLDLVCRLLLEKKKKLY